MEEIDQRLNGEGPGEREAAVGLAIILAIFRHRQSVDLQNTNLLKG